MGIRNAFKRVTAPVEELDREHRRARLAESGCCPISAVELRTRARLRGDVRSVRMVPRASTASLEITIDDGHGRATAIFFGRKKLPGIAPGRSIVIEGMAMAEHGQVVLYNPAYELL